RGARRAPRTRERARRDAARTRDDRRCALGRREHERRRHPCALHRPRRSAELQLPARARGADGVPARRVAIGSGRRGRDARERHRRICDVTDHEGATITMTEPTPTYYDLPVVKPPVWTWEVP